MDVPPPPPLEQTRLRRIRSSGIPLMVAAARAAAGESAWQERIQGLSEAARAMLEGPMGTDTWVDADLIAECLRHFVARAAMSSVPAALGAETARMRLPQAFQSPESLVAALPGMWANAVEGGRTDTRLTGPGSAEVDIWADWDVPFFFQHHLVDWLIYALRLTGAKDPQVVYGTPATSLHAYRATWA